MVLCVQHQQQIRLLIKAIVDSILIDLVKSSTQTIHDGILLDDMCGRRAGVTRIISNSIVLYTQYSQTQLMDTFTITVLLEYLILEGSLVYLQNSSSCESDT